jgi:hypothetical protein
MSRERYVVLGVARARAGWFRSVGQWATSGSLPAEFVRCLSIDELRARLRSGRPFSAALVDGTVPGVDRDLIAAAQAVEVAVLVVDDAGSRDWLGLGAAAVLGSDLDRTQLVEALAATSKPIGAARLEDTHAEPIEPSRRGDVVAVTGPGGTGASTVAIALAQGLASCAARSPSIGRSRAAPPRVVLADLCRYADQAMLHDARVVVPSIQELVEAHRTGTPERAQVLEQTFEVPVRGYRLVLGLRRPRHWVTLRARALEATLDGLQQLTDVLVADIEADVEGEAETGSMDVQERNLLARTTLDRARVVVVVGEPSMKGVFALARTIGDLLASGVPVPSLLPVINRAPRRPRARAEVTTALASLVRAGAGPPGAELPGPLYLPERPVADALRDGAALPGPLPRLLAGAIGGVMARLEPASDPRHGPERIVPGTFGTFTTEEAPRA